MDKITLHDLEVFYCVGVPAEERARPQRLLVSLELARDFSGAAATDDLARTIDYDAVARRLLQFGEGRSWKLLETLAADLAQMVLAEFAPSNVTVEIKKFVIPQARFVSVTLTRAGPREARG